MWTKKKDDTDTNIVCLNYSKKKNFFSKKKKKKRREEILSLQKVIKWKEHCLLLSVWLLKKSKTKPNKKKKGNRRLYSVAVQHFSLIQFFFCFSFTSFNSKKQQIIQQWKSCWKLNWQNLHTVVWKKHKNINDDHMQLKVEAKIRRWKRGRRRKEEEEEEDEVKKWLNFYFNN